MPKLQNTAWHSTAWHSIAQHSAAQDIHPSTHLHIHTLIHACDSVHPFVLPEAQCFLAWPWFLTLKVLLSAGNNSSLGASFVDWICRMWIPPCTADPTKGVHRVLANSARWKAPPSARMQGVAPLCRTVELTMPLTSVCEGRHLPAKHAKRAAEQDPEACADAQADGLPAKTDREAGR